MSKEEKKLILKELIAIAGPFDRSIPLKDLKTRCYAWRKLKRGPRARDWHSLLIMADKARDLNCEVFFAYGRVGRWTHKLTNVTPCSETIANVIVIYLPL